MTGSPADELRALLADGSLVIALRTDRPAVWLVQNAANVLALIDAAQDDDLFTARVTDRGIFVHARPEAYKRFAAAVARLNNPQEPLP